MHPVGPESSQVEYATVLPSGEELLKTLCGMVNRFGGRLVVGVEDDGRVIGVSEETVLAAQQTVGHAIVQGLTPLVVPRIYTQHVQERLVLIIEVGPGSQCPYRLRGKSLEEGVFLRLGASTHRAPPEMLKEVQWQMRGKSFDTSPCFEADPLDLSTARMNAFFASRVMGPTEGDEELLMGYQVLVDEQGMKLPSIGGILLFADEPQRFLPEAYVTCSQFREQSVDAGPFRTRDIRGPLVEQLEGALRFLEESLTTSSGLDSIQRENTPEVPVEVLREAIMNALVHRSYAIPAPIKIAVFPNRIEISSPGSFPGPLDFTQLSLGASFVRNRLLARAFRELGLGEKMGTGLLRIRSLYLAAGLPAPAFVEWPNSVKAILPRPGPDHVVLSEKAAEKKESTRAAILNWIAQSGPVSCQQLATHLDVSQATAHRQLRSLTAAGELTRSGKGPSTRYALS